MCGKNKFKEVIDFGESPLVNSLIEGKDLKLEEEMYPLKVEQCQNCFLVQVVDPVDSHKIYRDVDYLYFSSDMPTLSEYFADYARDILERYFQKDGPYPLAVEIGSNDGILLKHFGAKSWRVLGVDPATNVAIRAIASGIPTVSDFFGERIAQSIKRDVGQADLIMANNCIAHIDDLDNVMRGVSVLLKDDGLFVIECNYWGGMVRNKNYALIYHDHFSYFTLQNWVDYAPNFGLNVIDAMITPAQGGSLRVFMVKSNISSPGTERLKVLLKEEKDTKLNSYATARQYNVEVRNEASKLGALVKNLKEGGKRIAGYGAAAKGFSILQLAGITDEIDYFVDDSPAKQGKYTPVNHIPVISRKDAEEKLPDYFFITAPNYANVIIEKERGFSKKGGKFILADGSIV